MLKKLLTLKPRDLLKSIQGLIKFCSVKILTFNLKFAVKSKNVFVCDPILKMKCLGGGKKGPEKDLDHF